MLQILALRTDQEGIRGTLVGNIVTIQIYSLVLYSRTLYLYKDSQQKLKRFYIARRLIDLLARLDLALRQLQGGQQQVRIYIYLYRRHLYSIIDLVKFYLYFYAQKVISVDFQNLCRLQILRKSVTPQNLGKEQEG